MHEIRIHGRGGQGAVTAAEILAKAAFADGKYSQSFPYFGVERRGAPVMAYARIDDAFINIRQQVYEPDYVMVLDPTLLEVVNVFDGLKKDGMVIVNTTQKLHLPYKNSHTVDATSIALEVLGVPIVNTVMLGAFAKASKLVSVGSIKKVVGETFSGALAEKNVKAVQEAYDRLA